MVTAAERRSVSMKAQEVLQAACDAGLTLAVAESCTGGLLAALLTGMEGVSHAFERGFVVYTDEAKHEMLDVPETVLCEQGAVSQASAVAMAEGALKNSRADLALAITGYAGPAEPGSLPGLVHFALASRGSGTVHQVETFVEDNRQRIRLKCLQTGLSLLSDAVKRC